MIVTIILSLKVALISTMVTLPLSLILGYILSRKEFFGKVLVEGFVNLPLVMPPVTTGYLLLLILGRNGLVGSYLLKNFGLSLPFTTIAAVIAAATVSFPLVVRSVRVGFDYCDSRVEQAASTLGASPLKVFFTITIPLSINAIVSGVILGFARSVGEFGATITFAGNIKGVSQTIPLSIYSYLQIPGKSDQVMILVIISVIISFSAMAFSSFLTRKISGKQQ